MATMATNPNAASSTPPLAYNIGERALCFHGPLIYEAKILKERVYDEVTTPTGTIGQHYYVHYKGWKQRWDEWVPVSRLLKMTEANVLKQKELQQSTASNAQSAAAIKGFPKTAGGTSGSHRDNVSTRAGGRKDAGGTRGTKRQREDDDGKKPDMKLTIPEVLKVLLVDDWEHVTKDNQLVTLPRTPNVSEVLQEFSDYVKTTKPAGLKEPKIVAQTVVSGLQSYFDRALGANLLYRNERTQFSDVRKKYWTGQNVVVGQEKEMSFIYGAEHLLRMLVSLPQMIASSTLDPESTALVRDYCNELLVWMVKEKDRLFLKEYEHSTIAYQNLSRS